MQRILPLCTWAFLKQGPHIQQERNAIQPLFKFYRYPLFRFHRYPATNAPVQPPAIPHLFLCLCSCRCPSLGPSQAKLHLLLSDEAELRRQMHYYEWLESFVRYQKDVLDPVDFLKAGRHHLGVLKVLPGLDLALAGAQWYWGHPPPLFPCAATPEGVWKKNCSGPLCGAGSESSLEFLDSRLWTGLSGEPFPKPPPPSWGIERPHPRTSQFSTFLTTYCLLLTKCSRLLTTYCRFLTTCCGLLTTYCRLLIKYCRLLTAYMVMDMVISSLAGARSCNAF